MTGSSGVCPGSDNRQPMRYDAQARAAGRPKAAALLHGNGGRRGDRRSGGRSEGPRWTSIGSKRPPTRAGDPEWEPGEAGRATGGRARWRPVSARTEIRGPCTGCSPAARSRTVVRGASSRHAAHRPEPRGDPRAGRRLVPNLTHGPCLPAASGSAEPFERRTRSPAHTGIPHRGACRRDPQAK